MSQVATQTAVSRDSLAITHPHAPLAYLMSLLAQLDQRKAEEAKPVVVEKPAAERKPYAYD